MNGSPNGDYAQTVLENRRLNQDNTELRAKLKEKKADILVLERQGIIDRTKIEHLITKIEGLEKQIKRTHASDDREDLLRTIQRLNAAVTSAESEVDRLEGELRHLWDTLGSEREPFRDIMETKPRG